MQHKLLNCAWGSSEDFERTQSQDLGIRPMKPAARFEIATPTFQLAGEALVCETRTTYLKTACGALKLLYYVVIMTIGICDLEM